MECEKYDILRKLINGQKNIVFTTFIPNKNYISIILEEKYEEKHKSKMLPVLEEIKSLFSTVPSNIFSVTPKGGNVYLEIISKYE